MGGLGGSTDLRGTRLLGALNFDMIVLGAGTGIGIGGGGTDIFGSTGAGGIGADMAGTGMDTGGNTVDVDSDCGSGGGGGGCCTPVCALVCAAVCAPGKFGL